MNDKSKQTEIPFEKSCKSFSTFERENLCSSWPTISHQNRNLCSTCNKLIYKGNLPFIVKAFFTLIHFFKQQKIEFWLVNIRKQYTNTKNTRVWKRSKNVFSTKVLFWNSSKGNYGSSTVIKSSFLHVLWQLFSLLFVQVIIVLWPRPNFTNRLNHRVAYMDMFTKQAMLKSQRQFCHSYLFLIKSLTDIRQLKANYKSYEA